MTIQQVKDSFYIALRDRLAAINPDRSAVVLGLDCTGVLVDENLPVGTTRLDAFHLQFGEATVAHAHAGMRLMQLTCTIRYATAGEGDAGGDRGRALAAMDNELLAMLAPSRAALLDCTQTPPAALGGSVFWDEPRLSAVELNLNELRRSATSKLFYFSEVQP